MLVAATATAIPTIALSLRGRTSSPDSHIAAPTSSTEAAAASSTAATAAAHTRGPGSSTGPESAWNRPAAIPAVTPAGRG